MSEQQPPLQPPYAAPAGYPPGRPGQRPGKPRPSAGWFVGGIVLILAAVVIAVVMFIWLLAGFLDTEATLPVDGQAHQVSVGTDGERMLWLDGDRTACTIRDLVTGQPVELRSVAGSFERSDSGGDFEGLYRFSPGSGNLEVTCTSVGGTVDPTENVLVGPAPHIASFVVGILVAVLVPGLLGLAGLVMLLVTGILWSVRSPEPRGV